MAEFKIIGGKRLSGEHTVQGAKNSALPILAATVATKSVCTIRRCPDLSDVTATLRILEALGCIVKKEGGTITIDARAAGGCSISEELMREMRSSIIFLGPLLAALGCAELSAPGGCDIGKRPIDLHLEAMRALGVEITETDGRLLCAAPKGGLTGCRHSLRIASVGATENMLIAAAAAKGVTILCGAAREPEIVDLAMFLNACGAKIHGAGERTICIEGVERLHGCEHEVIPDRMTAVTFLAAAAATGGEVLLHKAAPCHMDAMLQMLESAGCRVRRGENGELSLRQPQRIHRFPTIRTMPYPGFPTDAQAVFMTLASIADGSSMITETIFENRFNHVEMLRRMGASIRTQGQVAIIDGVARLHGAVVDACDLRAGAALVLAGLAAEGETTVCDIRHVERGCERFDEELRGLGADIVRT